MALTVTSKRKNTSEEGSVNNLAQRRYSVTFEVDQTDFGPLATGVAVVIAAQAINVPDRGDVYSYDGFTDTDAFCQSLRWYRPLPETDFKRWHVVADYGPIEHSDPGVLTEPNPLLWPVIYDIDFIEEQVPLEKAKIVESLSHVGRAAGSEGPIINSCGVEFTEGILKTIYYPILIALKNYATLDEIVALNLAYQGTMNNGTYFGASARKAKYLSTASGGRQQISGQVFYPGTTRIWFKQLTWDRLVLNNGWTHFEKSGGNYILDVQRGNGPAQFRNRVHDDPQKLSSDPNADPTELCSEPLNLRLDGTLQNANETALYLTYRDLNEVNYTGIGIGG